MLGANDGVVSVSSLIVGVAAADPTPGSVTVAGIAGISAGAMSMAAGEYVSVSSQSDTEKADIARESLALKDQPEAELAELVAIYRDKGLSEATALQVARELTAHDAPKSSKPLSGGSGVTLVPGGCLSSASAQVRRCRQ